MKEFVIQYILTFYDILLAPVYFLFIFRLVYKWKKKYYNNSPVGQYFIPAFLIKMLCCVVLALIYNFYYVIGDCKTYYSASVEIWNATKDNPIYGLEMVFKPLEDCSTKAQSYMGLLTSEWWNPESLMMYKLTGFIGMFCFGTYLPIAFIFTLASFIGAWKIYLVFYEEFPEQHKLLALTCLFVPSALMWGTNVFKDPICLLGLGMCVTALHHLFKKRFKFSSFLELIAGATILMTYKDYILYTFLIASVVGIHRSWILNTTNIIAKRVYIIITILVIYLALVWCSNNMDIVGELAYQKFAKPTEIIHTVQTTALDDGASVYTIPNVDDFTPLGIIKSFLFSLNVAIFRPYLWETTNVLMLASALEVFIVSVFILYLLFKSKIIGFFQFAFSKPILIFALVFTFVLAPLAGFVSFNFGTLTRYKLPLLPLFYSYLVILYAHLKKKPATPVTAAAVIDN